MEGGLGRALRLKTPFLCTCAKSSPVVKYQMRDTFIFTDVHGCGDELEKLLEPHRDCQIISLGDNFDRALSGVKVWDIIQEYQVSCILGNHELKIWQYLNGQKSWLSKHYSYFLHQYRDHGYDVQKLSDFIASMPMLVNFRSGGRDLILVHGGIDLTNPRRQNLSCNVYGNFDPKNATPASPDQDDDWWNFYDGDDLVIYGHINRPSPLFKANGRGAVNSIGLDTGACHGGSLTGLRMKADGSYTIHSVKSKRDYFSELRGVDVPVFEW